jgi:DNA-binding NarL/FixJ family response regulator
MIRILLADDHAVVRQGLREILEKNHEMKIVAEFADGASVLQWMQTNDCDVALLDISMPGMGGIETLKQLREEKPGLSVLILSTFPEEQFAVRLIKAGASGYLSKGCAPAIVLEAVQRVASGKKYISAAVAEMLANEFGATHIKPLHETLSKREYQIFMLLASAKTIKEIADTLTLSSKTVSTYRSRILKKMHMLSNVELMHYAKEQCLTFRT